MARLSGRVRSATLALASVAAAALACGRPPSSPELLGQGRPGVVQSNVTFEDYAGTAACARCHASITSSWMRSAMHGMTRDEADAAPLAAWQGTEFPFKGDVARLETVGKARFMTITSKKFGGGIYRVTRVIGGRHREDYVGIPVSQARPDAPVVGGTGEEVVLPVSVMKETGQLRYKGYSVLVKERTGLRAGPVWAQTCVFCHNTVPYLSTILGALAGGRAPAYQGEVVDPLLPPERRATYVVKDARALESILAREMRRLGADGARPNLRDAITATRSRTRREHFVEVGIGCESCHLGSKEHVADPRVLPSFEPKSAAIAVDLPKGSERASRINRACARCHQVLFSQYEYTWEGGSRRGHPGGSQINSGEARDLLLGGCASKLACTDCHDPHASAGSASARALATAPADTICTRCHTTLASSESKRAHTHHDPEGEGARCVGCHMPRKNLSLDGRLSRYHRIGSPTDPERVMLDRPLECALCHTDATVEKLVGTMERWWNKRYERTTLARSYGSLDAGVITQTATLGKPHEQAVAFYLLGTKSHRAAIPLLAGQLTHPYPLVRGYAKRALDALVGHAVPIDTDGDDAEIDLAVRSWLAAPK